MAWLLLLWTDIKELNHGTKSQVGGQTVSHFARKPETIIIISILP